MGFLQEFLPESLALKIAVLAPAGLLILLLVNSFASERKIRALGGHAPIRKGWAPLGLDLLYGALKYNIAHRADEFFAIGFKMTKRANPWTYEMGIGHMRLIMTADPDNIKAILASQFADYGKGKQFYHDFEPFLGDSIFATDGQKWQNSRQMIRLQFVRDRLSDLVKFEHHIQKLLPMLGGKGQTVDIQTMFYCYTLDAATDFLLGKSIDSLGNEQAQFKIAFDDVQYVQSLIVRSGGFGWAIPKSKYYSGLKTVNEFTDTYIDAALRLPAGEIEKSANDNREHTFLHEAISYSRDRKVLRDQIIGILLAGRDTTAGTLSWFFYEISIKPKIVAKLRQEIIDTIGLDKSPTYEDLKSMKYLQRCINEILRLYPVTPYNMRVALKDTTLPRGGGPDGNSPIGILKDTPIGYSTLFLQRREDIYPPVSEGFAPVDEFAPERWEKWNPKSWTYIPFNGGPRLCVGQQFALTEMAYTITRILQRYERVECRTPQRPQLKSELVLQPAQNVKVAFF